MEIPLSSAVLLFNVVHVNVFGESIFRRAVWDRSVLDGENSLVPYLKPILVNVDFWVAMSNTKKRRRNAIHFWKARADKMYSLFGAPQNLEQFCDYKIQTTINST